MCKLHAFKNQTVTIIHSMFTKNSACPKLKKQNTNKTPFHLIHMKRKTSASPLVLLKLLSTDFWFFRTGDWTQEHVYDGQAFSYWANNSFLPQPPSFVCLFVCRLRDTRGDRETHKSDSWVDWGDGAVSKELMVQVWGWVWLQGVHIEREIL